MKINEIKHNHSLTDLLKVLLFSILMLLPFLDVAVRCGYVMFNKNAYQSYSENQNKINQYIDDIDELVSGNTYTFDSNNMVRNEYTGNTDHKVFISNINVKAISTTTFYTYENATRFAIVGSNNTIYFYDDTNTYISPSLNLTNNNIVFDFTYETNNLTSNLLATNCVYQTQFVNTLDNVFEYSVNKLESSNLYNWTTQTAIYSGVSQMTTQLGITGNIIPIILCYWFFITIIYIILDIVIKLFTILTHFIGSKTSS